jgi:hypothetical protein
VLQYGASVAGLGIPVLNIKRMFTYHLTLTILKHTVTPVSPDNDPPYKRTDRQYASIWFPTLLAMLSGQQDIRNGLASRNLFADPGLEPGTLS